MSHSRGRDDENVVAEQPPDRALPERDEQESVTVSRLPSFGPPDDQYPKPPTAWEQPEDREPDDPDRAEGEDANSRTQALRDVAAPPPIPAQQPFWGQEPGPQSYPAQQPAQPFPASEPFPAPEPFPAQPPYPRRQEVQPNSEQPFSAEPGQSYPGQPGQSYPGQPGQSYPGQPGQSYPGQSYPGQSYPGHEGPQPSFPGQPEMQGAASDYPDHYPAPPEAGRHYAQTGAPVAPPYGPPTAGPPGGPGPSTFAQQPVTPVRTARPEDLLVPNEAPARDQPASWGWRGRLNRGTGGLVKAKASAQESTVRDAIQRIQRGFSRPMTVVVIQPKGGAGKTPTTICLSAVFGAHRGGYVVGWDDNETRGTLAVRVLNPSSQTATAWDLLSDLASFERMDARVGDLSHYVRAQPDAHFDALVSDDNPGNMSQIGEDEFHRLHQVLQRFYRMVVVDTGNNVRSPNWQAAVSAADLVVVVSSYQRDVGYSGSWVLDHLAQTDREDLARNAVTVLTAADPTTDKTVRTQLVEHFTNRTRAVAEIPFDPALAHGGPIKWTELAPDTRNAWILAGATVVDALVERDQREQAERRGGN